MIAIFAIIVLALVVFAVSRRTPTVQSPAPLHPQSKQRGSGWPAHAAGVTLNYT